MRLVTVVLILLLVLIQYPLWWGHGGWLRVHELQQQLAQQTEKNTNLRLRNERVQGEVQDLQNGTAAVEERARYEMGMVKDSEVFVQFVAPNSNAPVNSANVPGMNGSTRGQVSAARGAESGVAFEAGIARSGQEGAEGKSSRSEEETAGRHGAVAWRLPGRNKKARSSTALFFCRACCRIDYHQVPNPTPVPQYGPPQPPLE
jgi:cell division protein FtsB